MRHIHTGGGLHGGATLGTASVAGVILEAKHGIPELIAPFSQCNGLLDALLILRQMSDDQLLGLFLWLVILVGSGYAMARLAYVWFRSHWVN